MRALVAAGLLAWGIGVAAQPSTQWKLAPVGSAAWMEIPTLDASPLAEEDAAARREGRPYRYGIVHPVKDVMLDGGRTRGGEWQALPDGRWLWRVAFQSEGVRSLDLVFSRFFLPHGAELWFGDGEGKQVHGPYTDAHNPVSGGLALPMVLGERALLELVVPAEARAQVRLELAGITRGYRDPAGAALKSGSCNIDTICPQGDDWREQIRGVVSYTFTRDNGDGSACTGQLVNNTAGDRAPLLLTANHCVDSAAEASSLVVYWRYESPTCRAVGSAANGTPIPRSQSVATQSGGTLLATHFGSDTTLVRLNQPPPAVAEPYWLGWDRRDLVPSRATTIHHPADAGAGFPAEKRISFENDPLSLSDYSPAPRGDASAYLRVADWDLGTTEGGSSGGALFNADKRVVGVLTGGFAACGNNEPDWYGRLAKAWTGGGSPASRLSDHLAPTGNAPEVLDGRANCAAPTLSLAASADPVAAGADVVYTATASGGSGSGYSYAFDIDGDGRFDREGSQNTAIARYDAQAQFNVRVRVRDGAGCEAVAQRAVSVVAPRLELAAPIPPPVQLCGDNDAVIEPGERWRLDVPVRNAGQRAFAADALALATRADADTLAGLRGDSYGYRVSDSAAGGSCAYQFVDLTEVVNPLPLTPAGAVSASDDGRSPVLDLSGSGVAFRFYDDEITRAVMSTNGYIGLSADTTGGAFSNSCGSTGSGEDGGRLMALHDDLIAGALRAAVYSQCPRPSEVGEANQRCAVFQWSNMGRYVSVSAPPAGNFDFQAIVYPDTWQIVYQYRNAIPGDGDSATVGIVGTPARLDYSCNQPVVTSSRAVCQYHPQRPPRGSADLGRLKLETPTAPLAGLAPGAAATVPVSVFVDPATACGSRYRVGLHAAADGDHGSLLDALREIQVGEAGNCNVSQACASNPVGLDPLRPGAFLNPKRPGNGLVAHVVPIPGQLPTFFGAWYTGTPERQPTWYVVQGSVQDGQVDAPILRFTRDTAASTFSVRSQTVGRAKVQVLGSEQLLLAYAFDGGVARAERMVHGFGGIANGSPNRTGVYFHAPESGWGQTYDSYRLGGVDREFIATYLYAGNGVPYWVLADAEAANAGALATNAYRVHCPGCGWTEFLDTVTPAGTMSRSFTAPGAATLSTQFVLPAPASGNWTRNAIPIQILTPVQAGNPP